MVIISMVITPVYLLFITSKKIMSHSKDITISMSLSSSYMDALKKIDIDKFKIDNWKKDDNFSGVFSLDSLGIEKTPTGFERKLKVEEMEDEENNIYYFLISVLNNWKSRFSKKTLKYRIDTLVTRKAKI
jgi:hypothetical protein